MTRIEVDAIVNAAKASLMGGGGIDGAIHKAAGHRLLDYCMSLGGCNVGEAKLSPGFRLPARYVIHTVGPIGEKPELLRNCYRSCLNLAASKGIRTLALCCISTGIYGYPNKTAAHVALRAVRQWLDIPANAAAIDRIIFCVFLTKDKLLYKLYTPQYFPPADPR
jgi:O-acetyl-ADP-ribose deacetylase (regulator of RNase III)